jgi:GGDEF domain-containing protein
MALRGETVRTSLSAGAAMIDRSCLRVEEVLAAADRALYAAKSNARGAFAFGEVGVPSPQAASPPPA